MTRAAVTVRAVEPRDRDAVLDLWLLMRDRLPRRIGRVPEDRSGAEQWYDAVIADGRSRLVVALVEREVVGMALLTPDPASAVYSTPAMQLTHLVVTEAHRRKGAGKAIVAAATHYAEELGYDHVVVSVYPTDREANRFYARLGFGPVVIRRVATVAALRRRLGASVDARGSLVRRELRLAGRSPFRRTAVRRRPGSGAGTGERSEAS